MVVELLVEVDYDVVVHRAQLHADLQEVVRCRLDVFDSLRRGRGEDDIDARLVAHDHLPDWTCV